MSVTGRVYFRVHVVAVKKLNYPAFDTKYLIVLLLDLLRSFALIKSPIVTTSNIHLFTTSE